MKMSSAKGKLGSTNPKGTADKPSSGPVACPPRRCRLGLKALNWLFIITCSETQR